MSAKCINVNVNVITLCFGIYLPPTTKLQIVRPCKYVNFFHLHTLMLFQNYKSFSSGEQIMVIFYNKSERALGLSKIP